MAVALNVEIFGYPKQDPARYIITIPKKLVDSKIIDPTKKYRIVLEKNDDQKSGGNSQ